MININLKKGLIIVAILGIFNISVNFLLPNISFASGTTTNQLKTTSLVKFVFSGTVTSISPNTLILKVTNTSANAKLFNGKSKTLNLNSKTVITKNGKNIILSKIKAGDKVKIFGIFNKKSGYITKVRWVKVMVR